MRFLAPLRMGLVRNMRNKIAVCCSQKRKFQWAQLVGLKTEGTDFGAWRKRKANEHANAEPIGVNFVRLPLRGEKLWPQEVHDLLGCQPSRSLPLRDLPEKIVEDIELWVNAPEAIILNTIRRHSNSMDPLATRTRPATWECVELVLFGNEKHPILEFNPVWNGFVISALRVEIDPVELWNLVF